MKALVLFQLLLLSCVALGAANEEAGGKEAEKTSSTSGPSCDVSHSRLETIFREVISEELTLYVNCLSFGETGELRNGVLSGVNETGGAGERLFFRCVEGLIITTSSSHDPSAQNMTSQACSSCTDSNNSSAICYARKQKGQG